METAASLAREGSVVLERAGIPNAGQDAELILSHVLGIERSRLHSRPDAPVDAGHADRYRRLVERRAARVPLQHLTGRQEFWSLAFRVTPDVLIPRPETELLIETFIELNRRPDPLLIDAGTGSGCIAVAAAHEIAGARIHAVDCSAAALEVARSNAADHNVADRIIFGRGDLFEPLRDRNLEGRIDFILSNPPYVGEADLDGLQPEVRDHEPREALTPGTDALAFHRRLAADSIPFLRPGGFLLAEFGLGQEEALRELYAGVGGWDVRNVRADLAGIPRVLVASPCGGGAGT